jgi:hypothetical protein
MVRRFSKCPGIGIHHPADTPAIFIEELCETREA